jgi:methyl-accepting chemotaxis protein
MKRNFRFPLFAKFFVGCLILAALLIIGGTYVIKDETRLRSRGNFMAKGMRRLQGSLEQSGKSLTGTAELLAAYPELRAALATTAPPPAVPTGPAPAATAPANDAATIGKLMHAQLMGANGLKPDVFMLFTPANRIVWAPNGNPLANTDLAQVAAVEKARGGSVFAHRVQLLQGVPYIMSAVPIRAPNSDAIVGGMLLGVRFERELAAWVELSDDPAQRYHTSLIDGTTVLASSLTQDDGRAEIGRAVQPDKQTTMKVGDDVRPIVKLGGKAYDFYSIDLEGYKNGDAGTLGKLFMTRARVNVVDPASKLPWLEIGVGIGAALLIALLLAYWVTRPIKQMLRQSRELLAGETDLTQRITVGSSDETADLADNINKIFERVHNLATEVQSAAFQVGASSAEISAASREMLTGLKDQTLKIESSTTAVTELSASIQQVAGHAAQATDVAEQSSTAVTSAVSRMSEIRTAVDDAAAKMRELGESSKRIGNIVEVIRQISEQTTMLALNASIEAAHAGEQGRGFAVVADEVSSLARRVGQSAKDIEALIQTVKEQTQAAIASMDVGTREVVTGSQLVTGTLTGLGKLITVVKDTAVAVHEQAVVSDEIARNMDAVRNIAGDVLHGSEESVLQSERLHELAFQLEESIAGFNLDGSRLQSRAQRDRAAKKVVAPKALPASGTRTSVKSTNGSPTEAGD